MRHALALKNAALMAVDIPVSLLRRVVGVVLCTLADVPTWRPALLASVLRPALVIVPVLKTPNVVRMGVGTLVKQRSLVSLVEGAVSVANHVK
jgi:hypothetical protein